MGKTVNNNSTQNGEPVSSVRPSSTPNTKKSMGSYLVETAWRVALPFLVFSLGGIWLDSKFETDPLYTVIGVLIALAAVAGVIYKYVDTNFPETFKRGKK